MKRIFSAVLFVLLLGSMFAGSEVGKVYATAPPPLTVPIDPWWATIDIGHECDFFSHVSGGTPPYNYQWSLNGVPVSRATKPNWTFNPTSVGYYAVYLMVTDAANAVATSITANVTVNAPPVVIISPSSATLNLANPTQLFTPTVIGGTPPYSFVWNVNGAVWGETYEPDPNWTFTPASAGSYKVYAEVTDADYMTATSNTASVLALIWAPSQDSYSQANYGSPWASDGNCYGLSSTEILYFEHYVLGNTSCPYFPAQNTPATWTSDLNLGNHQVLNNVSLAVMFHQVYDPNNWFLRAISPSSQRAEYNKLVATLGSGVPAILGMHCTSGGGHAVVAYGIEKLPAGTIKIHVSDPNVPLKEENASYDPSTQKFSYSAAGLSFDNFRVVTPQVISTSMTPSEWWVWLNWLYFIVTGYNIVSADKSITITSKEHGLIDDFTQMGNSQTFVKGIPGSSGIEEDGVQVYAIPKGIGPYTVSLAQPVASRYHSKILITAVDNVSGRLVGYGYSLDAMAVQGSLNFTCTPSSSGLSITAGGNGLSANVTFFSAIQQDFSIAEASNVQVGANQTANFTRPSGSCFVSTVSSESVVGQSRSLSMNVTVINRGSSPGLFNVTVCANETVVGNLTNVSLAGNSSIIVPFSWNTTGFEYGNYILTSFLTPAAGETTLINFNSTGRMVDVTIQGDINGDKTVNVLDLILIATHLGHNATDYTPYSLEWYKFNNCDLNSDGNINVLDLTTCATHLLQHW